MLSTNKDRKVQNSIEKNGFLCDTSMLYLISIKT